MKDNKKSELPETQSQTNPCLSCAGPCCSRYLVNLSTFDVWTIARILQIHPTDFAGVAELKDETPYSFVIDGSGRNYCLLVNKKQLPDGSRRCIFALNLPDPVVRCGIYSCQPVACKSYPLALQRNRVIVAPCICPEGSWDTKSLNLTHWQTELERHEMEFSIHAFLVARWNELMKSRPEVTRLNFRPFFEYVFEVYDQLDPVRKTISKSAWKRIYRRWRGYTRDGINPLVNERYKNDSVPSWSLWIDSILNAVNSAILDHQ